MSRLDIDHCVRSLGVKSSVQLRWPWPMAMVQEASGRRPPGMSSPLGVLPLPYWGGSEGVRGGGGRLERVGSHQLCGAVQWQASMAFVRGAVMLVLQRTQTGMAHLSPAARAQLSTKTPPTPPLTTTKYAVVYPSVGGFSTSYMRCIWQISVPPTWLRS